ncbi:MAG: type II CAAX prenyl endopeptidase Rce1 family protein [Pyrinomonadaceae bacterium]
MREIAGSFRNDLELIDRKAISALVYAAAGLAAIYYLKDQQAAATFLHGTILDPLGQVIVDHSENNLAALAWWVGVVTVFYFVVPASVIVFGWKQSLANYGLNFRIEQDFWRVFAGCVVVMLPLVYWAAKTGEFAAKYPFFRVYNGEHYIGQAFLIWELIYFLQFFGLEFFFRGFLVHSLKPALGIYSIFVMTVPYTMIHFGKPPAETFAAVLAGIFLGWLSYRNGNIWMGLLLHCSVAFSMDFLALYHKGLLL